MYKIFASVYDDFSDEMFYNQWYQFVKRDLRGNENILDLGCGSGVMLKMLSSAGFNVSGVDLSEDMLVLAKQKLAGSNAENSLYHEDMSVFRTNGVQYDTIISTCDSINYLATENKVSQMFANVSQMLRNGGRFYFDVHSNYTFESRFKNWSYADNSLQVSVMWNTFTEDDFVFLHDLTFFKQVEGQFYERFDETHTQYYFTKGVLERLLKQNGLAVVSVTSDFKTVYDTCGMRDFYVVEHEQK
ncbi:MAG: class I SAM-dependent DNA methyltransferase [Culicoidibacterales bacterium]